MLTIPKNCGSCLACEKATLVAVSLYKRGQLCGWYEFDGHQSTPPRLYRQYSLEGGWTWTRASQPGAPFPVPVWTETIEGVGTSPWHWDAATGELTPTGPSDDYTIDIENFGNGAVGGSSTSGNLGNGALTAAATSPLVSPGLSQPVRPTAHFTGSASNTSATVSTFSIGPGTLDGSEGGEAYRWTISSGSLTVTLFDEDTEADALDREDAFAIRIDEPEDLSEIRTLREDRADDSVSFSELLTKLAVICRGLSVGHTYRAVIEFEKRTAKGYGFYAAEGYDELYGEWEAGGSLISGSFVADEDEHVVGGSWSDDNEDGEIQADEVTPETDMPDAQGYEYRAQRVYLEKLD